jgi:hypothetical protein
MAHLHAGDNNLQRNLKRLMLAAVWRERKMFAAQTSSHNPAPRRGNPVPEWLNISRINRSSRHPEPAQRGRDLLFVRAQKKQSEAAIS